MNLCDGEGGLGLQAPVDGCDQRVDDSSRDGIPTSITVPEVEVSEIPDDSVAPEQIEEPLDTEGSLIIPDANEIVDDIVLPPENECDDLFFDPLEISQAIDSANCVDYSDNAYAAGSAASIATEGRSLATSDKKKKFIDYLAPIAIKIQLRTGLPASIIMSQAIHETAWGTSNLFEKGSAAFGHSCWNRNDGEKQTIQLGTDPDEFKEINVKCNHPRPRNEGGFYLNFESMEDSVLAYANNLLYNPRTARHYKGIREVVAKAKAQGKVANYTDVVKNLGAYAADQDYIPKVRKTIDSNDLTRFDSMNICGSGNTRETHRQRCNDRIDDTGRELDPLLIDPASVKPNNEDPRRVGPR
jgi:flagellum-specific peptidoglycan hydrolase FlgJ